MLTVLTHCRFLSSCFNIYHLYRLTIDFILEMQLLTATPKITEFAAFVFL